MQGSLQKLPQIKILPAFRINEKPGLRKADLEEVAKTVQGVIPLHADGNVDVTITLLEKNLSIFKDIALMKTALTNLVRTSMDAMPGTSDFSLTINRVNFEIESLLSGDDPVIGACAFISFGGAGAGIGVDEKIKEKAFEPFFTTKTEDNGLGLAVAYRIVKRHHGRTETGNRTGQGTEINIYLPLTKSEMVSMMSIPTG